MKAIRDAFGEALVEVAAVNANVMAVSCDLRGATRLQKFLTLFQIGQLRLASAKLTA